MQRSIKHSSKKLIEDRIQALNLRHYFTIKDQEIDCNYGDGVIIFNGLQNHTVDSIKSLEGFTLAWIEEAQTITAYSLELLTPTIRKDGAKIFCSWNPKRPDDPVEELEKEVLSNKKITIHANYIDNPFCTDSIIDEAEEMKRRRPVKYKHIYLGGYGVSEGLVFENVVKRVIMPNEVEGLSCYQGLDFGFTNDPSAFSINYLDSIKKRLYVFDGFIQKGLLNEEIAKRIRDMERHRHTTTADSAEPKSIATIGGLGVKIRGSIKGKDSINIGIDFLKNYDIIVNAHLDDFMEEFENYTWEKDKMTNKPTNKPIDEYNHGIDSIRYSVSRLYIKLSPVAENPISFF